ncbi:MAG: hypothetical protein AB1791_12815 [Chloroflexota bacterium]
MFGISPKNETNLELDGMAEMVVTMMVGPVHAGRGQQLWRSGAVTEWGIDPNGNLTAAIRDGVNSYRVNLQVGQGRNLPTITGFCQCRQFPCAHAAAALFAVLSQVTPSAMDELDEFEAQDDEDEYEQVSQVLQQLTVAQMRMMAQRRGWPLKGTLKEDIVSQTAEYLLAENNQAEWLKGLRADERNLLAALHILFGLDGDSTFSIEQSHLDLAWKNLVALDGKVDAARLLTAREGLQQYGVLYACHQHFGPGQHYHTLTTLAEETLPLAPIGLHLKKLATHEIGRVVAPPMPYLQQLAYLVQYVAAGQTLELTPPASETHPRAAELSWVGTWPHVAAEVDKHANTPPYQLSYRPPTLTVPLKPTLLTTSSLSSLLPVIPDQYQLESMVFTLLSAEVLRLQELSRPEIILDEAAWNELAALAPPDQFLTLFSDWFYSADLGEVRWLLRDQPELRLWRLVQPEVDFDSFLEDLREARQLLVRFLRSLAQQPTAASSWYSLNSLLELLWQWRPTCYHTFTTTTQWGFQRAGRSFSSNDQQAWRSTYGRMIQALLEGPLYWMGLVNLSQGTGHQKPRPGQPASRELVGFQLTEVGRWALAPQLYKLPDPVRNIKEEKGAITWLDQETVQVKPGQGVTRAFSLLSRLGEATGQPFTYRLAGPGLEVAFAQGQRPADLARQLAEGGAPLPATSLAHLEQLYDRYGQIHLYEGLTVIELADDMALPELRASGLLGDALVHEFSPRLVVIKESEADSLVEKLIGRGHTPRVVDGRAT